MDNPALVCRQAGVYTMSLNGDGGGGGQHNSKTTSAASDPDDFMCDICCNEGPGLKSMHLPGCDHVYCVDCWKHYLTLKITKEGESRRITCQGAKCDLIVDEKTVADLVDPAVLQK